MVHEWQGYYSNVYTICMYYTYRSGITSSGSDTCSALSESGIVLSYLL
jgi:hypothetical protein